MMMKNEKKKFIESVSVAVGIVVLMWSVELYEVITDSRLYTWGIYPRAWDGLLGIIRSPFLHSNWGHLIANSGPMLMLVTIIFYFYRKVALPSIVIIMVLTGFLVWLFAKPSYHIGASGVVYGLVSFVFWSGIFKRNTQAIVLALIILTVFASYFVGIMPDASKENISWESHLFGGLVGIFTAFLFKNTQEEGEELKENVPATQEEKNYFLPSDVFEKTKYERYLEELQRRHQEELKLKMLTEQRRLKSEMRRTHIKSEESGDTKN